MRRSIERVALLAGLALGAAVAGPVGSAAAAAHPADARANTDRDRGAAQAKAAKKKPARASKRARARRRAQVVRGRTGPRGAKGGPGPAGGRGEAGARGPKGENGGQGPKGDSGPQGPKGDTGPQGPGATGIARDMTPTPSGTPHVLGRAGPFTLSATCTQDGADVLLTLFVAGPAATVDGYITREGLGGTNTTLVSGVQFADSSSSPVELVSVGTAPIRGPRARYSGSIFTAAGGVQAEGTFAASAGACRASVVSYPFS
ncbi:hypothetical protein [Conexibacter sp. CPCC 206217]|uniref:hypothetical protein n=1 Tax=Conexibacter sp. CPCC 206217 TaxID=3064574 RepID=UPI00271F8FBC|nr:hypothetical protein [Conexibacter sp. CPCC 206217]MDO8210647.1 hypothetical protein [Conexibacter sp. CPCC 206217]